MIDTITPWISVIIAIVALYFSTKKQKSDIKNSDADTITQMFTNFKEQEARYKSLRDEFDEYRRNMDAQFAAIATENVKLRAWARNLVRQLEQSNIIPIKYDG